MKRIIKLLTAGIFLAILLSQTQTIYAATPQPITVLVDGQELTFTDVQPIMVSGRTLVPVRGVFEHMGFDVLWDYETSTAYLTRQGMVITVRRGDNFLTVDGQRLTPDVPPQIVGGRFLLPLRAVAEATGVLVDWVGSTRTVLILTRDVPAPVTLTAAHISSAGLNNWLAYYHASGGINEMELEMFYYVNMERERMGADPLALCPVLSMAARFKSQEMIDLGYFAHESPVYGHFSNIPRSLFGAEHIRGENLFRRVANPYVSRNLVLGLEDISRPHWENMTNPDHRTIGIGAITALGVGVNLDGIPITNRYAVMITHMFGAEPSQAPAIVWAHQIDPACCENCEAGYLRLQQLRDDASIRVVQFSSHGITFYIDEAMFAAIYDSEGAGTEEYLHWLVGYLLIRGEARGSVYLILANALLGYYLPGGSDFIARLGDRVVSLEEAFGEIA